MHRLGGFVDDEPFAGTDSRNPGPSDTLQMAILSGGLGTRLGRLTSRTAKGMVLVSDKPFLHYQLEFLGARGITNIIICTGHLAQQIKDYFGDGQPWGVDIKYSDEEERLLDTAGALKKAEPLLQERFFVMYGDSYLPLDFSNIMARFTQSNKLGMMVVYRNKNKYDTSNVILGDDLVRVYDKKVHLPEMTCIDAGVSVLRKDVLRLVPPGEPYSLEKLYQELIVQKQLQAYETRQRFYEIGSPGGLEEFEHVVASGGLRQ